MNTPSIVTVAPGQAAVLWWTTRFADTPRVHRAARARIQPALAAAGARPAGPWVTFSRPPRGDAIEIAPGVMVDTGVMPADGVTIEAIPACRTAHLRLDAPYERLAEAWRHLMAWVETEGLVPAGLHWEVYEDPTSALPVTHLYTRLAEPDRLARRKPLRI